MTLRSLAHIPLLCFILACSPAFAQEQESRQEIEERLRDLREQIALDQERLAETAEAEEASVARLKEISREIALREELTRNYQRRMRQLSFESDSLRSSISALEQNMEDLQSEYEERAVHAYKYGRMHDLALILAAQSINEMLVRARYLRRFADQRRERLEEIQELSATYRERRNELELRLLRNEQLLRDAQTEQSNLVRLQRDREQMVAELRSEKSTLLREKEENEAAVQQLEALMRRLAAAESARRREREANDPAAEAAYVELSGSFLQNRGRLPWPAEGVVTEPYGNRISPVYGTVTNNPGILVATRPSAEVRAVFDGEVLLIDVMPEYGTLVTLGHGEYKSVYANFSMLYVRTGDRVRAGQVIGRAGTDTEPRGRGIFFALFKEGAPVDPVPWLTGR